MKVCSPDQARERATAPSRRFRGLILDPEIIAGGVQTLREHLVPELARHFEELRWAVPPHAAEDYRQRHGSTRSIRIVPLAWPATHWKKWRGAIERRVAGSARSSHPSSRELAAHLIERFEPDFILSTCVFNQPPPFARQPLFGIICDVNPRLPEATRANMAAWTKKADRIFAISNFTRRELARLAPVATPKIQALPLAAALPPLSAGEFPDDGALVRFLYPAAANGHKNHLLLFQAAWHLARRGHEFRIVLTGTNTEMFRGETPLNDAAADEARQFFRTHRAVLEPIFEIQGEIQLEAVRREFGRATALVLPSSYEGFGLPLAEGIAAGLPMICSDIPAYLEQLDTYGSHDRAIVFNSGDLGGLTEAMHSFLLAPLPRFSPGQSRERLARWTWADAANLCARVILETCGSPKN